LEYADRSSCAQHSICLDIVERKLVEIWGRTGPLADSAQRVTDHSQSSKTEEVHLEHAHVLERVHVVLGYYDGVLRAVARCSAFRRLGADGHVFVERARCNDDAGGVHASMTGQALELHRVIEQLPVSLLSLFYLAAVVFASRVQ